MSHETDIVNKALNKFQLSSGITLDSLRSLLLEVVGIFDAQGKGALNVSKNMVIVLHKVLVTNEPSFLSWIGEFADENFSSHIVGLRSLRNSNEICYNAMAETHTQFSARCIQLTDYDLLAAEQGLLIFSQQKQGGQTLADLSLKKQRAADKALAVRDFCYRNRVSM